MAFNIYHLPIYLSNGQSIHPASYLFPSKLTFFYLSITNSYVGKKNIQREYNNEDKKS